MKKLSFISTLVIVLISLILTTGVIGDTSDDNRKEWEKILEEMREEIKKNGHSFTVGYTPICEYRLEDLCCFKPELAYETIEDKETTTTEKLIANRDLPSRYIGYYTPAKYQGGCGSCWAFCMASAVEGLFVKTMGTEENLSEQWLLDCNPWGWDCGGGFINFNMFISEGSPTETCYPYVAYQHSCWTTCPHLYFIYDWDWVLNPYVIPPIEDIKQAIMEYGSVAVGVRATAYMQAYTGGIFDRCESGLTNHCVALCGWDDELGGGVWLLKNSWGDWWGGVDIDQNGTVDPDEGGFMWIIYGCNRVGEAAAYPIPYFGG